MYQPLVPCASCRRHVRASDALCPFCRAAVSASPVLEVPFTARLSRGGLIALASLAIAGCHSEATDPVVAKDPATIPAPTPTPTPDPKKGSTPPAPSTTASDVDDPGAAHAEYGAPAPPPPPKPAPTSVKPSMAPAYGGAPKLPITKP